MQAARLGWGQLAARHAISRPCAAVLSRREWRSQAAATRRLWRSLTQLGNEAVIFIGVGMALMGVWNGKSLLASWCARPSVVISKADYPKIRRLRGRCKLV